MRASHNLASVAISFDEDNLVSIAGLVAPATLAQRLGVAQLVGSARAAGKRAGAAKPGAEALTVLGAMLAGDDSIDDVDVLSAGAAPELFDDVPAPSPIGTWLRAFRWANVRELDAGLRETLAAAWAVSLGPGERSAPLTIDVDSTGCRAHGGKKHGCRFGYTKVRGFQPLLATVAPPARSPPCACVGNAASSRGAASCAAETHRPGARGGRDRRADGAR